MTHTRTELDALTAKALRPIAADLGIVGASRMKKGEIVSAIIGAQAGRAAADGLLNRFAGVESSQAEGRTLREQYDGTSARFSPEVIDLLHGFALKMDAQRDEALASVRITNDVDAPELTEIPEPAPGAVSIELSIDASEFIDAVTEARIATLRLLLVPGSLWEPQSWPGACVRVRSVEGENVHYNLDSGRGDARTMSVAAFLAEARPARCPSGNDHTTETCLGCGTEDAQGHQVEGVSGVAPNSVYVRATGRGVETVVVEEVRAGRVKYRVLEPKTGKRSAPYGVRQRTFERDYRRALV